jgi:hypothetical protein
MLREPDFEQHHRIASAQGVVDCLKIVFERPSVSIVDKKGVWIPNGFFYCVPDSEPGSVNRWIASCSTVPASKEFRPFFDVRKPGIFKMLLRRCHQCNGCMGLSDFSACQNRESG